MRYMVASDIHGSALACELIAKNLKKEKADRLILLGDILYHGPRNDLPERYDPKACIKILNKLKDRVLCVRGNCDSEVDQMVLEFPILADYAIIDIGDRLIYATHGHILNKENIPPLKKGDILLHGHTHVPASEFFGDGLLYMNPGSVAIPKDNSPQSYMIIDKGLVEWKTISGKIYHQTKL
ncbi:hypothetical protein SAMN05216390_13910 [Lachnospiraceae bacterium KH1T2]|nr:hypothetical protein SAMN05216390_13910 [Lachnospiraceae bacterium KH1T2]